MIFVALKPLDQKKEVNIPPYLIKLTQELLKLDVNQFKIKVHEHFKPYISPFINDKNLKLSCKYAQSMINYMPLYMYIDNKQYTQYIQCTTQPNMKSEQQQRWKNAKNLFIYTLWNELQIKSIHQKQINRLLQNVLNKVKRNKEKDIKMIINGMIVQKTSSMNWVQFIQQHWQQFNKQNGCIYARIISQE